MPEGSIKPPRTERRIRDPARTRESILATAEAEFARHGFGGGRVDRIARKARANKRMIYHYFGHKDGLYLAVLERVYAAKRAAERALEVDHRDPEAAIRLLVDFNFDYCRDALKERGGQFGCSARDLRARRAQTHWPVRICMLRVGEARRRQTLLISVKLASLAHRNAWLAPATIIGAEHAGWTQWGDYLALRVPEFVLVAPAEAGDAFRGPVRGRRTEGKRVTVGDKVTRGGVDMIVGSRAELTDSC